MNAIPYVGWALLIIATVGVNYLDENTTVIQDIKNWAANVGDDIANGWNSFCSFNWV